MRNVETLAARIKAAGIKANIQHLYGGCIGIMTARRNVSKVLRLSEFIGLRHIQAHEYCHTYGLIKSRANKTPLIIFY